MSHVGQLALDERFWRVYAKTRLLAEQMSGELITIIIVRKFTGGGALVLGSNAGRL